MLTTPLPPIRLTILRAYLLILVVYAVAVAGLYLAATNYDAGIPPKILTRNYDSIRAAERMRRAWHAPLSAKTREDFSQSLRFAQGNVTEAGEAEAVVKIRGLWQQRVGGVPLAALDGPMNAALDGLVHLNELGMGRLADEARKASHGVLVFLLLFFALTLALTLLIAGRLARGLSRPLIQISTELSRNRSFEEPLGLPASGSRELEVLRLRLSDWWDQVRRLQRLNVDEILAQRNKLEAVFASVEDAVLLLDKDAKVAQLNQSVCELLATPAAEAVGMGLDALGQRSENGRRLRDWLASPRPEGAVLELSVEKRPRVFAVRQRVIQVADGGQAGRLVLLQDVTERRQRERLEDEFIGVLSHELKTPLQSLGTAVELLERKKSILDPSLHIFLETIVEDLGRIRAVANDFVQVSQLNVRSIRLEMRLLALDLQVREWLRPFEVLAAEKGVQVTLSAPLDGSCLVRLDPVKFSWVLSNLLSNALRVSQRGQELKVSVSDQKLFVELRVEDQGPGIPEEMQRRMFEPYFQAPATDGDRSAGLLGLGLTIAKEMVEAHEGAIEYFRGEAGGSVFRVLLPAPGRPKAGESA